MVASEISNRERKSDYSDSKLVDDMTHVLGGINAKQGRFAPVIFLQSML